MNISLKNLFFQYKIPISFTFILLSIEAIFLALIPFGIGKAIDSLLKDDFYGLYILLFILFVILVVSTLRRVYDTRLYSSIYASLGTNLIKKYKKQDIDKSVIVTRSNLIKELVDFFEEDLTATYTSLIAVLMALFMIFYIDFYVAIICFLTVFSIYFIYLLSEKKIYFENTKLNNELEKRVNIIDEKNTQILNHFKKIKKSMVILSDIESFNFVFIQIFISLMIVGAIYLGIKADLSAGDIFAMLTYVLNFSFELLTLPLIYQQYIRLKEISNRI